MIRYLFNNAARVKPPMKRKIIVFEKGAIAAFGSRIPTKYAKTGTSKAVTGKGMISVIHKPAQTNNIPIPFCVMDASTILFPTRKLTALQARMITNFLPKERSDILISIHPSFHSRIAGAERSDRGGSWLEVKMIPGGHHRPGDLFPSAWHLTKPHSFFSVLPAPL